MLNIVHFLYSLFKYVGLFGVSKYPKYYKVGDKVPYWLEATFPINLDFKFIVDCEVYYEYKTDLLIVRPLYKEDEYKCLLEIKDKGNILVAGAPTGILVKSRLPPRKKIKNLIIYQN